MAGDTPGYVPRPYAFYDWNRMLELNERLADRCLCDHCRHELEDEYNRLTESRIFHRFNELDARAALAARRVDATDALHAFLASLPGVVDNGADIAAPTAARQLACNLTISAAGPPAASVHVPAGMNRAA